MQRRPLSFSSLQALRHTKTMRLRQECSVCFIPRPTASKMARSGTTAKVDTEKCYGELLSLLRVEFSKEIGPCCAEAEKQDTEVAEEPLSPT